MSGYNGWTNYETWCVNLWIDNDPMQQGYWWGECEELLTSPCGEPDHDDHLQDVTRELTNRMKSQFVEEMPEVQGMWADLLTTALARCNWREIAEHFVDAVSDEIDFQANHEPH